MRLPQLNVSRLAGFILGSCGMGAGTGAALVVMLIAADVGGVRTLVDAGRQPVAPVILVLSDFATLIGSLYAGTAIMTLPRDAADGICFALRDR